MKQQTESRVCGRAWRRLLAGVLAALTLCTAVPAYAEAPADTVQPAGTSQAAEGTGGTAAQESTPASSSPEQAGPSAPSEDVSAPADDTQAPSQEAAAAPPEEDRAAQPQAAPANGAEKEGKPEPETAPQESTSLPVAGQTYWFPMDTNNTEGGKFTTYKVREQKVPAGLKWVPFTFSGTINAYVLTDKAVNLGDSQKVSEQQEGSEKLGSIYDHQIFLSNHVLTDGPSWDNANSAGLIFGKDYKVGGITYKARALSCGAIWISGNEFSWLPNCEYSLMNSKGYVKNPAWTGSWAQDPAAIGRDAPGQKTAYKFTEYEARFPFASNGSGMGLRPVFEVPQGQENSLHAVALDLGQFKLKTREGGYEGEAGPVQTMNVVMAVGAGNSNRPAYEELAWAGSNTAPEKESLIWIADNGKTYTLDAPIPVDGITKLTLGVKEKDESGMAAPGLAITAQPQNVTVKEGQSASFAVQAVSEHGLGTLGYSWEVKQPQAARTLAENDGWGAVGLQSTYTLASTALGQSGTQYRCKVTLTYIEVAEGGTETKKTIEAYSDAATLTVTKADPPAAPGGAGVPAGQKPNPKTAVDGWQGFWQDVRALLGL